MDIAADDKAKKDFEELLAAVWAKQLAGLRTPVDLSAVEASGRDRVKAQEAAINDGQQEANQGFAKNYGRNCG